MASDMKRMELHTLRFDELVERCLYVETEWEDCIHKRNTLRTENERLREALREIANSAGEDACGYTTGEGHSNCIWKARQALKEVTK